MDAVTGITNALGGGAIISALGYAIYFLWKLWTHREERHELQEKAEAQSLDAGFSRLVAAAERQDTEIERLGTRDVENRRRIEALEVSNRELAEENRTFRTLLGALVEGLRRKPPDDAETLLDLILSRAPFLGAGHKTKE